MEEIYVSTDIEANGAIPGRNSMLSFGSAAFTKGGTLLSTFTVNLDELYGAGEDQETMEWWKTQPDAWKACRSNIQPPRKAMYDYLHWLKSLPGMPVFVGYPATFDFMFVYWYLIFFTGESPFSFSAIDIKTYAMAMMHTPFKKSTKRQMPKHWFSTTNKHTHTALDDAIEQGILFCNMLKENSK